MNYGTAIAVDLLTLLLCGTVLWRHAQLSHVHPATTYFLFHIFVFTVRLLGLYNGSPTLFTYDSQGIPWPNWAEPVTEVEIVQAMFLADLVLVLMTAGWILAARNSLKAPISPQSPRRFTPLRPTLIWIVVTVAFPLGVLGIAFFSSLPGRPIAMDLGEWNSSSYPLIAQSWAGLALLALIYLYGFRLYLMVPMAAYLGIMAYQGFHRFRVLIPIILMIQIYLSRTGRVWPTRKMLAGLVIALFLFFPLKQIGRLAQRSASIDEYITLSETFIGDALTGGAADQQILDEFAAALALVDQHDKYFYGQPYLALLTIPVPRQMWPDKPSTADYLTEVSRRWRPMRENGMVVTFIGELYAQLGVASVVVGSFVFAYLLGRAYHASAFRPYYSVERFYYLSVACNLIQVYRDGLVSLFVFVVINMSPIFVVVVMHLVAGIRRPLPGPAEESAEAPFATGAAPPRSLPA
jgi:hypothetical protein